MRYITEKMVIIYNLISWFLVNIGC